MKEDPELIKAAGCSPGAAAGCLLGAAAGGAYQEQPRGAYQGGRLVFTRGGRVSRRGNPRGRDKAPKLGPWKPEAAH
jgi:hypothetical protein